MRQSQTVIAHLNTKNVWPDYFISAIIKIKKKV